MHKRIEPPILYVGTPVVLVSTENEDGSVNVAPISSAWFLGWTAMLGFDRTSKTPENLQRTGECVLNLPSVELAPHVDRLALTTGSHSLPLHKRFLGYRVERDKLGASELTPTPSELVRPPRLAECPIQLEARLEAAHPIAARDPRLAVAALAVEVRVLRVHVDEALLEGNESHKIDPVKWRPLVMSFRRFFGLGPEVGPSALARGDEMRYAPPAVQVKAALRAFLPKGAV